MRRSHFEPPPERGSIDNQWNLDIPLSSIRHYILSPASPHRSVRATLHLSKASSILQSTKSSVHPEVAPPWEENLPPPLHCLPNTAPQERQLFAPASEPGEAPRMWILDFMNQMLVLSKSRMRAIQNILDHSSRITSSAPPHFNRNPSWVNLMFDPLQAVPQERYTTVIVRHFPTD